MLGIYIDKKLNFEKHITNLTEKVEKRQRALRALVGKSWGYTRYRNCTSVAKGLH